MREQKIYVVPEKTRNVTRKAEMEVKQVCRQAGPGCLRRRRRGPPRAQ